MDMFRLKRILRKTSALLVLCGLSSLAMADSDVGHVLEPMDLSSPRATLSSLLEAGDSSMHYFRGKCWKTPSRESAEGFKSRLEYGAHALDLSEIAPAARFDIGRWDFIFLYETISRLELPPEEEIPSADHFMAERFFRENGPAASWTIPHTEITITRIEAGVHAGQFRFSPATVARAEEFYEKTMALPYQRDMPMEGFGEMRVYLSATGWIISSQTIEGFPSWMRYCIFDQAVWKWGALVALLCITLILLIVVHRVSRRGCSGHSVSVYLRRLATPLALCLMIPMVLNAANQQLTLLGWVSGGVILVSEFITYFSIGWIAWIVSILVAEAVIASPQIPDQSLNAHLLRLMARCLGITSVIVIIFHVSNRLGAPLYGLVAGLGVGGFAIALAAQNTIEDFIGSLNLFADSPVRVGDFCRYGEDPSPEWQRIGTVESIGLRSTRIRGIDKSLTTIPNGEFSRMHIVNYTMSKGRLLLSVIGLRYETSGDQLRVVLAELRKMLAAHPRVLDDTPHVRFASLGEYSLNIEIRVNVDALDIDVFLDLREEVFLKALEIIKQAGTSCAFPSQTVYYTRDQGVDKKLQRAAAEQVKGWSGDESSPSRGSRDV